MFLIPRTKKIQSLKYDPHDYVVHKKSSLSKGNKQNEALAFMRKIFCNQNLTHEEAFSPDCTHLLNLINVLFPCELNTIVKTNNKEKLQEQNLKQYLSQLKSRNYQIKNFPKEEYFRSNKVGIKKIVSTILHLKSEYEENGRQRKGQNSNRLFYLKNKSLKRLKSKEIYGINPFLTNQKIIKKFQSHKTVRIKNIFYLKDQNQLALLRKRSEQLGYPLSNNSSDSSSLSSIESTTVSVNTNSEPLFDFHYENYLEDKEDLQEKNQNDQKGWDEVDINQISGEGINDDSNDSVTSSSENENNNSDSSDFDSNLVSENQKKNKKNKKTKKQKETEKKKEKDKENGKENEKEKEKEIESSNWPSFGVNEENKVYTTYNTKSKRNKSGNPNNTNQKTKENPNLSDSSDFDSIFKINTDSQAKKKRREKKNRNQKQKRGGKSSNTPRSKRPTRTNMNGGHTGRNNNKRNNKGNLAGRIQMNSKIPLQISKNNIYLKMDLINLFKSSSIRDSKNSQKKRIPRTNGCLHLIFHIVNSLDKWRSNDPVFSKKFSGKYGYPNLYKICTQAYKDAINLGITGAALFDVRISKNFSTKYSPGLLELTTRDLILTLNNKNKKPLFKQKFDQYQIQISLEKNSLKEISLTHLLVFNTTFSIKFHNEMDAILAIMTLGHFFKMANLPKKSKKRLGYNPVITKRKDFQNIINLYNVDEDDDNFKISELIIPPLVAPNMKFLKKLTSIDDLHLNNNLEKILAKFYQNGGVNFLCTLYTNKKYPLISSFIEIRKTKLIIGYEKKIFFKIPFSAKPQIAKNDKHRTLFSLEWTQKATCSAKTRPLIRIVCTRTSERSLITKAIDYFNMKWNDNHN
ncbi:hypothetical protein M0812_19380 [Anaeramoeba flamelloides]|uniref:Uncharacterized protein n=1 Tax=Anaeramoeba flamelloides TaxID=1746091 RepID=A0AAV7Z0Q0_9EUKA|nr:hypothetical protein M0812_19380 [Anaeramoeba flamelloides]